MKFAQYLEDTQTPEWQRAYINYRLLKKRITAIRKTYAAQNSAESPVSTQIDANPSITSQAQQESVYANSLHPTISATSSQKKIEAESANGSSPNLGGPSKAQQPREPLYRSYTLPASITSQVSTKRPSFSRVFSSHNSQTTRRFTKLGPKSHPYSELPLRELLPLLSPTELAFFTTLDEELEKIENFYLSREKEMKVHTELLQQQLDELEEHERLFEAAYPTGVRNIMNHNAIFKLKATLLSDEQGVSDVKNKGKAAVKRALGKMPDNAASRSTSVERTVRLDPDEFHDAKHKLKKAVLEHYRGLEMLQNYRILNLTGIRKALKKFQKVTKIAAQNAYMTEKVDKTAFASETNLRSMMEVVEEMYATRFAHGDKKRALNRLRSGPVHKSHHLSSFWSGLFLGLAGPALVAGLYHSYQQETRDSIPGWDALLLVYAVFFIPVLLSLLVSLNILVWARSRINYVFIFEFDLRTRMDHREYSGIPSLLLAALCYAFWLSFARIGAPSFSPTLYPLVWLAFAAIIMLDPFPFLFKPSRYWLLKNVGKLLISGTRRVEFADFWMGDQFCSLVFTLSNLDLVVCLYVDGFSSSWRKCSSSSKLWPLSSTLAILPFLVRLIQSIKRYADSGLNTHLINGGKYGAGIVAYVCYFIWRHKGGYGPSFAIWVIFQTAYSIYACTWDFIMDWSILGWNNQYPFLRKQLVYSNHIYLYYFAILSNILIRFIWILYVPIQGPDMMLRAFIGASLEMLRRWQWNFYRIENEHLGNVDQYRVTREVPLPYSLDEPRGADADDDEDHSPSRTWFPQRAIRLRRQRVAAPEV